MSNKRNRTSHEENLHRMARIEGQVRGVSRMVENSAYCIDIITQIQAVQAALGAVSRKIMEKHLRTCVKQTLEERSEPAADQKIQELMSVMKRICR